MDAGSQMRSVTAANVSAKLRIIQARWVATSPPRIALYALYPV
jgi:hypothetical protein